MMFEYAIIKLRLFQFVEHGFYGSRAYFVKKNSCGAVQVIFNFRSQGIDQEKGLVLDVNSDHRNFLATNIPSNTFAA
jgi:hypothetical protein